MRASPRPNADPLLTRLRALAQVNPAIQDAAALYQIVLPHLRDADLHAAHIELTPNQARKKMEQGLPLLHDAELAFDETAAHNLLIRLVRALEKAPARIGSAARQIRVALEQNKVDSNTLWQAATADEQAPVMALAQEAQLDHALLWTLAQNTFKPALSAWQKQLAPFAPKGEWQRGYCYVCGTGATLGELQGNDQEKHLRCGRCGADWEFRRLQCMYCGNDDPKTLGFFQPDRKNENARVEVCDHCKGYVKVISSFSPNSLEMLIVEDLATLPLDFIARQRGYARGEFR